jgi:hypothetical protein
VYGSSAVLKLDGDGPAGFYDAKGIATWLQQQLQLQSVYLKNRWEALLLLFADECCHAQGGLVAACLSHIS